MTVKVPSYLSGQEMIDMLENKKKEKEEMEAMKVQRKAEREANVREKGSREGQGDKPEVVLAITPVMNQVMVLTAHSVRFVTLLKKTTRMWVQCDNEYCSTWYHAPTLIIKTASICIQSLGYAPSVTFEYYSHCSLIS